MAIDAGSSFDDVHIYGGQTRVRKMTLAIEHHRKSSPGVGRVLATPSGAMIAAESFAAIRREPARFSQDDHGTNAVVCNLFPQLSVIRL